MHKDWTYDQWSNIAWSRECFVEFGVERNTNGYDNSTTKTKNVKKHIVPYT